MRIEKLLQVFDISHDYKLIDFKKGENREQEYLDINPFGLVPTLVVDRDVMIESGAITLFLADLFAEKMNTPKPGTVERARMYEWILFIQATLEPVAMEGFTTDDKSKAQEKARKLLTSMASRFRGPYVLGEEFSFLDVVLNVELSWYKLVGMYPEGLEPYDSFLERTNERLNW